MSYFSTIVSRARNALLALLILSGLAVLSSSSARAQEADSSAVVVDLTEYVGTYGERHISMANDRLTFMRDGMPMPVSMSPIDTDHFKIDIPPGAQVRTPNGGAIPTIRFDRDEDGVVVSLSLVMPDGNVVATSPKGDAD